MTLGRPWLVALVALAVGSQCREPCTQEDVRAEFSALPNLDSKCLDEDRVVPSAPCLVTAIEGAGPIRVGLECEAPFGAGASLEIDLSPVHPIDVDVGAAVTLESDPCESSVRLTDERGLIFAAVDHRLEGGAGPSRALEGVLRPLEVGVDTRSCPGTGLRGVTNGELTIRDGEREVRVYSGNSAILEGSPRWLVVVDTMLTDEAFDQEESVIDVAVLRVR
ncbi:MAG: hypothetical protein R3B09_28405 [Nannocystaceae bacterium]